MCKDTKKESIIDAFWEKNMLYNQNFIFFEVFSIKCINFAKIKNATNN